MASDRFFKEHQRYPGELLSTYNEEEEIKLLNQQVIHILEDLKIDDAPHLVNTSLSKSITNYVRFGNKEIPNISALIGGLVAQEAIKLITHQYIPINNTCIFNGIASTSSVFEL